MSTAFETLHQLTSLHKQIASLEAARLELLVHYEKQRESELDDEAIRSVPDEVALALHVTRGYVLAKLRWAHGLLERLPETFSALRTGKVDFAKARALVEITEPLSVEHAREVEAKVLPRAGERTAVQVRASARYQRDRIDPAGAEARRRRAHERRRVWFEPSADGAGELTTSGAGDRLYLAWQVIDGAARQIKAAGDARPLDAIRHDVHLDLILGKYTERVQVQVYLHVPATTLAGVGSDPGILAGYGPVTAQGCRELAAGDATWRRVFTDPISGRFEDVERKNYRPPKALAEYVRLRDRTCVAPGCVRPAQHCPLDHTVDWAKGGPTTAGNLGPLCVVHHRLKHLAGWRLEQIKPGIFRWTSPIGQTYHHQPESQFG